MSSNPIYDFFAWIYNFFAAANEKIFPTSNSTHRTERLVVQGLAMMVLIPVISYIICWKFIWDPLMYAWKHLSAK